MLRRSKREENYDDDFNRFNSQQNPPRQQVRYQADDKSPTSADSPSSNLSPSIASYAPTAATSVCALRFDVLKDEALVVGDDGYDPSTSDHVGCVPLCDIVQAAPERLYTWLETPW